MSDNKAQNAVRWILVLPAAIAAYVLVTLVVGIASELAASEIVMHRASSQSLGFKNFLSQLINSITAPVGFVYLGAKVAPSHRFITAVVLASAFGCLTLVVTYLGVAEGVVWWLILSSVLSIVAVVVTCIVIRRTLCDN